MPLEVQEPVETGSEGKNDSCLSYVKLVLSLQKLVLGRTEMNRLLLDFKGTPPHRTLSDTVYEE